MEAYDYYLTYTWHLSFLTFLKYEMINLLMIYYLAFPPYCKLQQEETVSS